MTEKTTDFFSFENNPFLDTAREAARTGCDIFEGVAREQIAGETKFVDLSAKQFYACVDAKNIEDMIKANREWIGETFDIVTEHSRNAFTVFQDAMSEFISSRESHAEGVTEKVEKAVGQTTRIVDDVAA